MKTSEREATRWMQQSEDDFKIPTRYPNGLPGGSPFQVFDHQDLKKAVEALEQIMAVCRGFLAEKGISY